MRITLTNDFHNTEAVLRVNSESLSPAQVKRAKRLLCGVEGCTCSGEAGERGAQPDVYIGGTAHRVNIEPNPRGGADVWLDCGE